MKFTVRQSFDVHFCFQDEGSREVIAFDVSHRWILPECRPGVLCGDESLIRVESCRCRDEFGMELIGFDLRFNRRNLSVRLGHGRRAYRFPIRGTGSGGNMYWEVITFPIKRQAHVLNWLRRQPHFSKVEWQTCFEPVWHSRRPLDWPTLRRFGMKVISAEIKHQAQKCDCTVEQLIKLSMPQ